MHDQQRLAMTGLAFGQYTLRVNDAPFECRLLSDEPVWQLLGVRFRSGGSVAPNAADRRHGRWQDAGPAKVVAITDDECHIRFEAVDTVELELALKVVDDLVEVMLTFAGEGVGAEYCTWVGVEFAAAEDEHFLGMGERFDSLDQRGRQVELWVTNGAQRDLSYIPVPFYLSSAGYGLHIDTDVRAVVRFATADDPGVVSIRNAAPSLRLTLIPGSNPKAILSRYTAIAGRPATPPGWVFGPWKSRDWRAEDQKTVYEDAERQRQLDLPSTVKLIDARWESAYHTFAFDPAKYPDAQAMIRRLDDLGYRLVVWTSPWMAYDDDPAGVYRFCADKDYLIKNPQGETYVHRLANSPTFFGSCFDFTNPEAVAWWQEQIRRLMEMGVAGFKTDFGEQAPEDAVFHDGSTGAAMHNVFPRLYNQVTYEAMSSVRPGVLLARSGWHGSQGISAIWAGDQTADFAPASGLRSALVAGQSAGLSGFPFWGSDIGGYFGMPTEEAFVRWAQFGAFSPIMQIHGAGPREPWLFSAQTLEIYRQFAKTHIELFPYLYTYACEAAATGLPVMRAMALEFPGDPAIWSDICEHQYCFGRELLVAPVYDGIDDFRPLYLPAGEWRDFWSGEVVSGFVPRRSPRGFVPRLSPRGGRLVRHPAALHQLPVFARAGAIVPRLDPAPDTLVRAMEPSVRQAGDDLRLDIYPGADGQFTLFDGATFQWQDRSRTLRLANSPVPRTITVCLVAGDTTPNAAQRSTIVLPPDREVYFSWPP